MHDAINSGIQRIITAEPHMQSGFENCATLTDQDAPGGDKLPTKTLYAKAFTDAVTPIPGATTCLLMRHDATSTNNGLRLIVRSSGDNVGNP
jgi:hypothetical protein